jgi:hypothetical protein
MLRRCTRDAWMVGHYINSKPEHASTQGKSAFGSIFRNLILFTMTVTLAKASENVKSFAAGKIV